MLAFHGAPPPRLADQRARAARAPLRRSLGAGGELLHRARRGAPPRARQYADPAARRALDATRHRPHAGLVHLRDQRPLVLVRGVLREGIQRRRILVRGARRDRLRAHLLGCERARVRPPARRGGAARRLPLAELRELRVVDLPFGGARRHQWRYMYPRYAAPNCAWPRLQAWGEARRSPGPAQVTPCLRPRWPRARIPRSCKTSS